MCWWITPRLNVSRLSIKGTDFIFISEQTVFAVEVSEKAWVIVVVASVGRTLNDKPSYLADKILFSDMSMLKDKNYYMIPATLAKTLQQEVYNADLHRCHVAKDYLRIESFFSRSLGEKVKPCTDRGHVVLPKVGNSPAGRLTYLGGRGYFSIHWRRRRLRWRRTNRARSGCGRSRSRRRRARLRSRRRF